MPTLSIQKYTSRKSMNKARYSALEGVIKALDVCQDKNELLSLLRDAVKVNYDLIYSRLPFKINWLIIFSIYLTLWVLFYEELCIGLVGMGLFGFLIFKLSLGINERQLERLSDAFYRRKIIIEKNLYNISGSDLDCQKKTLANRFVLFRQGDKNISLNLLVPISNMDEGISIDFFEFEYEVESESDGKTTTHHYKHYGFIFPLEKNDITVFNLRLPSPHKTFWRSESRKFNKLYSVSANSQQAARRFLTPWIIQKFIKISDDIAPCHFEIYKNRACLSFCNCNFLALDRSYDIREQHQFYDEIKNINNGTVIDRAVCFINELCKRV